MAATDGVVDRRDLRSRSFGGRARSRRPWRAVRSIGSSGSAPPGRISSRWRRCHTGSARRHFRWPIRSSRREDLRVRSGGPHQPHGQQDHREPERHQEHDRRVHSAVAAGVTDGDERDAGSSRERERRHRRMGSVAGHRLMVGAPHRRSTANRLRPQRPTVAGAGWAGRTDLGRQHSGVAASTFEHRRQVFEHRRVQASHLARGDGVGDPPWVESGVPQQLVDQHVAEPGDRVLVEQHRLQRRPPTAGARRPIRQRVTSNRSGPSGATSGSIEKRAQPPRIVDSQHPAVGELDA